LRISGKTARIEHDPRGFPVTEHTPTNLPAAHRDFAQQGFILITVIWLMAFLSFVGIAVTRSVQAHIRQSANHVQSRNAELLADSGVTLALLDLAKPHNDARGTRPRRFPIDGTKISCTLDDAVLTISIQDAGGRISLNSASDRLLQALFMGLGSSIETARRAADVMIDFRDSDDLRRVNGAEKADYNAAGRVLGPKNAAFDSIDELYQVLGIDAPLISAIKPYVTVNSVTAGLDPRVTSPALIELVAKGARQLPNATLADQSALPTEFVIGSPQRAFHISVHADVPGSAYYVRDAVAELSQGAGLPNIKHWKRGYRQSATPTETSSVAPPNC
jgi:general secretion pathway protein K